MAASVLVLAAHPDDEVLGCGGTMAALAERGHDVHVVFFTGGEGARGAAANPISERQAAARKACHLLGAHPPVFNDLPDNELDTVSRLQVTRLIEAEIHRIKPSIIFTHSSGDVNIDHRRVYEATIPACRPQNGNSVKTILFFEVPSSTEWQMPTSSSNFHPNWFYDINKHLETKISALQCYSRELRKWPHPRSVRGVRNLAEWRGATIGVHAAEAFVLGRHLP